jgi:DegT/DnrJ/EryC1/StrS aminotransferase family
MGADRQAPRQIAFFSFHPRKVITAGEGGMLTTSNPDFDHKFRLCRQHGMSVSDTVRHGAQRVIFEDYLLVGFNYRMTDVQAAVGRKQLERLAELVSRRRVLADCYAELLGNLHGLSLPDEPDRARSNWQSYCVRLPNRVDQKAVMQSLLDQGIATRRGIMRSHREQPSCRAYDRGRTGFIIDVDGYVELALETYAGAKNLPEWRALARRRWVGAHTGAVRSDLRRRVLRCRLLSSLHQNRRVNTIANSNLSCCS